MNPLPSETTDLAMNGRVLQAKLEDLRQQLRELHRRRAAAKILCLAAVIAAALAWLGPFMGWPFRSIVSLFGAFLVCAGLLSTWWARRLRWSDVELARMIEQRHPDLNALLLTAVEQLEAPDTAGIFKARLLDTAAEHGARSNWTRSVTRRGMRGTSWGLAAAATLCLAAIVFMFVTRPRPRPQAETVADAKAATTPVAPVLTATVTPGDTEVERGTRLVVEAKFDKDVPAEATLIVTEPDGVERERIPMRLTVDQQVFGGLVARVDKDARYRVEFGTQRTRDYQITTYVHPALERADVRITPPAYSGLPAREIKNTLKVTAMEHSDLEFRIKINKPVKEAELYGQDKTSLPLKPLPDDPTTLIGRMTAEKTQKWRLHLVDDKERANKNPPWLSVTVQSNQLAKIEVVFPKRDVQVSAIQELPVEARVWDDLGVLRSGASFSISGKIKDLEFQHDTTAPAKKAQVQALLAMEQEGVEPRQLVSYYFWAEDKGAKGEVRRAMSDMFFAEVRHFEDIFREAEAPPGEPGQPQKNQTDKLVELQKQVVNATWRVIRDTQAGRSMDAAAPDVEVVHESQGIALEQTKEAMEEVEDAEVKTFLTEAWKSMKDALDPLQQASAEKKKAPLNQALTFEQSALEWLHRAQSREHRVMRQNQPSQASAGQQADQNQLMNLELKQQDQRYEEEKQAGEEQTAEQQENLQVLNRLKELARRQEALAEKMKQLQNQLAKAETEEQRSELQNQLQRLQDEQEQLLRDLDDLKERMEQPDNAANMAEAREQLEQTREQVVDAAEKLKEQQLADAANSATRAQRELEKMQEDFRQKTANRFAEEMKQLRAESRAAAERQKQIGEALENQKTAQETADTSASLEKMLNGSQVARQIEEQQGKLKELLENMRRISEEAEGNNPLLHRNLYEAVRDAQTGGLEENLQEARDQARYGNRRDAQEAERKAGASVEQLQKGVEKAAESVLGSETEALRMARSELDKLLQDVRSEGAASGQDEGKPPAAGQEPPEQQTADKGGKPGEGAKGAQVAANEPGDAKEPGENPQGEGKTAGEADSNASSQSKTMAGAGQSPKPGEEASKGQGQGKGQGKGKAPSESPGPEQANAQGQGKGAGQAKAPSESPGQAQAGAQGQEPSQSQAQAQGEGQGQGKGQGQGQGQGQQQGQTPSQPGAATAQNGAMAGNPGQPGDGQSPAEGDRGGDNQNSSAANRNSNAGGGGAGPNRAGDDRRRTILPNALGANAGGLFFDEPAEAEDRRPLTGSGYGEWTDRLRNVEELLSQPELRNDAARILDNARAMRVDHERNNMAPQSDHLQMRITQPLVELRDRVAEELAKRDAGNPMVPVDRDPVPPAFRDLVRRYYTELGAGK